MNNTHYTCWNTTGNCTTIYYIYFTSASYCFYLELSNGKSINDAINEMVTNDDINKYDSSIKGITDAWYRQNVLNKTNMIEDTVYCNARNITSVGAFNKDGGSTDPGSTHYLQLKNYNLSNSLVCPNNTDQFAISNNKARLTFPVALLQDEERVNIDTNSLMATGTCWWSLSPTYFNAYYAGVRNISADGSNLSDVDYVNNTQGTRPSISLKDGITISSGDGSETSPWIVDETSLNTTIDTYNNRLKNTYLSDTYRNKIKTITLSDSINIPANAVVSWDIGVNQNNKVMAYLITNSTDNTMYDLYIQGDGELKANYDSSKLFYNMPNLTTINNLTILDTSETRDMTRMFAASKSLTTIDVSNFNTDKLTNMKAMFGGFDGNGNQVDMALTNIIGLNDLNTSNVENMDGLFSNNNAVTTIDISNWNTHNVRIMSGMFNNSNNLNSQLTTIIFGANFNTSKVVDMNYMFADNPNLVNLDVSGFNTPEVTSFRGMFTNCKKLTSINVTNWDTSKVTDMSHMFSYDTSLQNLDVSGFNTPNVTTIAQMFRNCTSLTTLNLSSWDTRNLQDMYATFGMYDDIGEKVTSSLTTINISGWNTPKLTRMNHAFLGSNVTSLNFSGWNTPNLGSLLNTFAYCENLTSLDISSFNLNNITNMWHAFKNKKNIKTLRLPSINYSNITDYSALFTLMATKAQGMKVYVKDTATRTWILNLTSADRPSDWDTTNVLISS